jgi:hypothetical protein
VPRVSGFVVKSCKTIDDFEARRFAEDLYYESSITSEHRDTSAATSVGWSFGLSEHRVDLISENILGDYLAVRTAMKDDIELIDVMITEMLKVSFRANPRSLVYLLSMAKLAALEARPRERS